MAVSIICDLLVSIVHFVRSNHWTFHQAVACFQRLVTLAVGIGHRHAYAALTAGVYCLDQPHHPIALHRFQRLASS